MMTLPTPLATLRRQIPCIPRINYLANCSQAPLTTPVYEAIEQYLQSWMQAGMDWDRWMEEVEAARAAFARLIHAQPEHIAVGTSVSQLVSSVASALASAPRPTRRRILSSTANFPGVGHAWSALRKYGWTVDVLPAPDGLLAEAQVREALREDTALLSVPHVYYGQGACNDLSALLSVARSQGSYLLVDAYQSLGTIPIDVQATPVDFLVSGTLKYLLGTAGIAFLYVRPELLEHLEPAVTGWFGRRHPFDFSLQLDYAGNASRFDLGTPPVVNAYAARSGMEMILHVGVAPIRAHLEDLTRVAFAAAFQHGLTIAGPQTLSQRGATIAFDVGSTEQAHALDHALHRRDIHVAARGAMLRLAPHGFTTEAEIVDAITAIAQLLHKEQEGEKYA